jgi:ABC-type transport system involved in cytochrome c biogenesis permease component
MIFLPIVVRELRVAARRKSTYRTRFWTASTAVVLGSYIVFAARDYLGRIGGAVLLTGMAALCFLWCLSLAGNTVDCISEEKREGTLGFLFLTDLKGHDIALGKLFSTSLISFYALLGVVPIVTISLLLGGVNAREIWEVALALLNAFFFSHTAGILVSTLSRKRGAAAFSTAALLLCCTLGFLLLSQGLEGTRFGNWASELNRFNPAYSVFFACVMVLRNIGLPAPLGHYWTSLLLVHVSAWLFLAAASWRLPRCWQEKSSKAKFRWRERFQQWYHNHFTPRTLLLDTNPFLWLALRNKLGSLKVWGALLPLNCYGIWLLAQCSSADDVMALFSGAIMVNHAVLKILVATGAGENFEEQRHNGTLEFLLSCTPLSVPEILAGQWTALRRQFFSPMIVVLASDLVMLLHRFRHSGPGFEADERYGFTLGVMAAMTLLVADTIALAWLGMWNGMSQKKARHAAGSTVAWVLVVPWIILIAILSVCGLFHFKWIDHFWFPLSLWFGLGIAMDAGSFFFARHQLLTQFRALAAPPTGEELGLFGRLGRLLGALTRPKPE